jgi:hypothetical protein
VPPSPPASCKCVEIQFETFRGGDTSEVKGGKVLVKVPFSGTIRCETQTGEVVGTCSGQVTARIVKATLQDKKGHVVKLSSEAVTLDGGASLTCTGPCNGIPKAFTGTLTFTATVPKDTELPIKMQLAVELLAQCPEGNGASILLTHEATFDSPTGKAKDKKTKFWCRCSDFTARFAAADQVEAKVEHVDMPSGRRGFQLTLTIPYEYTLVCSGTEKECLVDLNAKVSSSWTGGDIPPIPGKPLPRVKPGFSVSGETINGDLPISCVGPCDGKRHKGKKELFYAIDITSTTFPFSGTLDFALGTKDCPDHGGASKTYEIVVKGTGAKSIKVT